MWALGCSGDLLSGPILQDWGLGTGANMGVLSGLPTSTENPSLPNLGANLQFGGFFPSQMEDQTLEAVGRWVTGFDFQEMNRR